SGAAPAGGPRVDRLVLGNIGKQSQGKILPADAGGAETTGRADGAVGAGSPRDWPHSETGGGVSTWVSAVSFGVRNGTASGPRRSSLTSRSRPTRTLPGACRTRRPTPRPAASSAMARWFERRFTA